MKEKERGGRCEAVITGAKRMIQVECGTNLSTEMTDVFSMVFINQPQMEHNLQISCGSY